VLAARGDRDRAILEESVLQVARDAGAYSTTTWWKLRLALLASQFLDRRIAHPPLVEIDKSLSFGR
jgi:hypothetical protein